MIAIPLFRLTLGINNYKATLHSTTTQMTIVSPVGAMKTQCTSTMR